tara:strand:- start:361 stop:555 length:195 start_codon:yes stop_codon:yes gene_type:complete
MSTISELDAAVEEYNGVVKRQQEANKAELQPLAVRIQELQGKIINEAREADQATTEDSGEACPA